MHLAERLRRRRAELGYTQVQLGYLLGLPSERIGLLERDAWPFTLPRHVQERLARVLGCPVTEVGALHRERRRRQVALRAGEIAETLGARILHRRCALGLTQAALGARLRVDRTAICRWEKDRVRPRLTMRLRLARALECRVEELTMP